MSFNNHSHESEPRDWSVLPGLDSKCSRIASLFVFCQSCVLEALPYLSCSPRLLSRQHISISLNIISFEYSALKMSHFEEIAPQSSSFCGSHKQFCQNSLVSAPCYCLLCIRDTQQYSLSLELEYNSLVRDHFSFPPPLPDPKHHLIRSSGMKSPFSNVSQSPLLQLSTELPEFPP